MLYSKFCDALKRALKEQTGEPWEIGYDSKNHTNDQVVSSSLGNVRMRIDIWGDGVEFQYPRNTKVKRIQSIDALDKFDFKPLVLAILEAAQKNTDQKLNFNFQDRIYEHNLAKIEPLAKRFGVAINNFGGKSANTEIQVSEKVQNRFTVQIWAQIEGNSTEVEAILKSLVSMGLLKDSEAKGEEE